jgi:hypothetical protein
MKLSGAQRAEGEYMDRLGMPRPVHFIKVGERWWLSGYTLEYETDTDKREMVEDIADFMLELSETRDEMEYLRPLIARVQQGDFKNADEAREALGLLMKERWEARRGRNQ